MTCAKHAVIAGLVALSLLGAQVSADLYARTGADVNGLALFTLPALLLWLPWAVVHRVTGSDEKLPRRSASPREERPTPATAHTVGEQDTDAARRPPRQGTARPGAAAVRSR